MTGFIDFDAMFKSRLLSDLYAAVSQTLITADQTLAAVTKLQQQQETLMAAIDDLKTVEGAESTSIAAIAAAVADIQKTLSKNVADAVAAQAAQDDAALKDVLAKMQSDASNLQTVQTALSGISGSGTTGGTTGTQPPPPPSSNTPPA